MQKLKQLRMSRNIKQKDLAEAINVSPAMISRYENGQSVPPTEKLTEIAKFFEVDINCIIGTVDEKQTTYTNETKPTPSRFSERMITYAHAINNYWALNTARSRADGKCELCGDPAPFKLPDGSPYLEFYLILQGDNDSSELPISDSSVAVVCPTCNARLKNLHSQSDIDKLKEEILKKSSK